MRETALEAEIAQEVSDAFDVAADNYLTAVAAGTAPYCCRYCGAFSWLSPRDQTPPVDYCHSEDHGDPSDFYPKTNC